MIRDDLTGLKAGVWQQTCVNRSAVNADHTQCSRVSACERNIEWVWIEIIVELYDQTTFREQCERLGD